jgi:hypothetical protein
LIYADVSNSYYCSRRSYSGRAPTLDLCLRTVAGVCTHRVSCRKRSHPWGVNRHYSVRKTLALSKSIQWRAGWHVLRGCHYSNSRPASPLSHLYPLDPASPNLLTSHSLPFCKQHLYGSYAFAGRKVAYYSRYSIGVPPHSSPTEEKPVLHREARSGFDRFSQRARLEILTISVEDERANKQCGARIRPCS